MMNLWLQISLCGLFLVVNACDDIDKPIPPEPQVPQLRRPVIKQKPYIEIISTECPEDFEDDVMAVINQLRSQRGISTLKVDGLLSNYSLNSAIFYAQNEIVSGQAYRPPTAPARYPYKEFVFRKSVNESDPSNEYVKSAGETPLASAAEVGNLWIHNSNGRSTSDVYELYGEEPKEPEAEKWDYFTQAIWDETTSFGLGCVTTRRTFTPDTNLGIEDNLRENITKTVFNVVANFHPPGNQACKYRLNVLPPKKTKNAEYNKLLKLYKNGGLAPTSDCLDRDKFYYGMQKCPPTFEKLLVGDINRMRVERNHHELKIDNKDLSPYSQEYVNWLIGQPHEAFGNEPNNQKGGDIAWSRIEDNPDEKDSLDVKAEKFSSKLTELQARYISGDHYNKEPSPDVREEFKDFTRALWKNTKKIGLGCGLDRLPGQNKTRAIVVLNFDPPGNHVGYFVDNVKPQGGSPQGNGRGDDDSLGAFIGENDTISDNVNNKSEDDYEELEEVDEE